MHIAHDLITFFFCVLKFLACIHSLCKWDMHPLVQLGQSANHHRIYELLSSCFSRGSIFFTGDLKMTRPQTRNKPSFFFGLIEMPR